MIPVILSGGSGTRLWPLSRTHYPKQFLPLTSENTMLQETWLRLEGVPALSSPIAVCNEAHRFMVAEQLREIDVKPGAIILEPFGRNTAPAIALAALSTHPDEVLLVLPSDHVILQVSVFQDAVKQAERLALQNFLVTFGIVPTHPETGYGYIKRGAVAVMDDSAYPVAAFAEKPDLKTAQGYLESGDYLWNSGMFAFKAGVFLQELEKFNPQMLAICREAFNAAQRDVDFVRIPANIFTSCPSDSVDYAVMEKTDKAMVIPLDAGWNDVGSWSALWEVTAKDDRGNAIRGDVLTVDTHDSFIHSENKLVAVVGIRDLVVVETDDAVMIAPKDRVQDVKLLVEQLKNDKRPEADVHRKVYRPWGFYDEIDMGERHKTKRIEVKPGAKLSLQMHHHRAEHWVVVKGTALVTRGEEQVLVSENQSTFIPLGVTHRLENPGVIPLEMIEVQSGSYLGEDDIVRFSDHYGRQIKPL
ncbi:mannose-1-phosphate guanylyltransferase/mannose-6-phosphate isomerase [Methylomicrobium sp. Wu6]|uniref:mannose-1-phosphate guanylyltransferase/mannose-6-phosphate isomerase n=1 Tax=Methylomicrobium sp. Wu6 TaxID=3107928 RepID=UPI002DD67F86|nr:mannose-1-phosphate guanylyltransferase/mannose-6-phosphate isomerase [Methylomicrobium sp. Wu6]MEC4747762.1 mannose-1-phosphate guanylyltransferase/mannose-6-phosphate isomerase [Methylomicrobium sp. Wu6]